MSPIFVVALALFACKRKHAAPITEVWDEPAKEEQSEAAETLTPPWRAPTRGLLENGLILHWLHEPGSQGVHIRLMLPITMGDEQPRAAARAAVVWAIAAELERRLERFAVTVEVDQRPGRSEIGVHGRIADLGRITDTFGQVLGDERPSFAKRGGDIVRRHVRAPTSDDVAYAWTIEHLLGQRAELEHLEPAAVVTLSRSELDLAWRSMLEPRHAVLVVHTGRSSHDGREVMRRLAAMWPSRTDAAASDNVMVRLRSPTSPPSAGGHLVGEHATALFAVERDLGRAVVVLGRLVPAHNPQARAIARLSQRLLQERMDARLSMAGNVAVLTIRIQLGSNPDRSLEHGLEKLRDAAADRLQMQHLFQAAHVWLGARVVQASLDGEDWTALWSEAIDLASHDTEIVHALARDAQHMLAITPEALAAWHKAWLDPRHGRPGWTWVVAGASKSTLRELSKRTPIRTVRSSEKR